MAVAHKDLTGTDLHEVKGASTATIGQVPVANGAGGAPFGLLTHTSLTTTGNPFGAQLLHVREEQTSGTSSTTPIVNSAFNVHVLNTVKTNEISGASLAANTITLPAGTYYIEAFCNAINHTTTSGVNLRSKARLRNTTDGTTALVGGTRGNTVGGGGFAGNDALQAIVKGRFTLAGTKNLQLQQYINSSAPNFAVNISSNTGETEVYSEVFIWKIA